jgi:hypothetical protein
LKTFTLRENVTEEEILKTCREVEILVEVMGGEI